jgi:hypothetical protein
LPARGSGGEWSRRKSIKGGCYGSTKWEIVALKQSWRKFFKAKMGIRHKIRGRGENKETNRSLWTLRNPTNTGMRQHDGEFRLSPIRGVRR